MLSTKQERTESSREMNPKLQKFVQNFRLRYILIAYAGLSVGTLSEHMPGDEPKLILLLHFLSTV